MNGRHLLDSLEHTDPELVAAAAGKPDKKGRSRPLWMGVTAAVAAVAIVTGIVLWPGNSPLVGQAYALAVAEYPTMAPYPNESDFFGPGGIYDSEGMMRAYDTWWADQKARLNQPEGYDSGLETFYTATLRQFLGGDETDNRVYAPLNVYFALGMLAELTDGNSRQQILDLLGRDSIQDLRTQAAALWNANYCDDGSVTSILASSLWLDEGVPFVQSTLNTLADTYYASSYQGEMGSAEFNQALQTWLNDQTGGLLEEEAGQVKLGPETVLALATTIYFRAKWVSEFQSANTTQDTFHAAGGDITCDFMRQSSTGNYYWGETFSAVEKSLENSGQMWVILPDEGVEVNSLLEDEEVIAFLLSNGDWDNQKDLTVNLSLPKFDVSAQLDLIEGLKALGITDVFDPEVSDFTPMTREADAVYVSQATHAARVAIDEEGLTAAAFTVMAADGSGMPPEDEIDFVVNRPFLFVVTGAAGQPLFAGVVYQPA